MTTTTPPPEGLRDRSVLLLVVGSLEILIGIWCLLMGAVTLLGALVLPSLGVEEALGGTSLRMMLTGALFYVEIAVFFIWIGIGTMLARRWARALMLIVAWFWLVVGVFGMGFWIYYMPHYGDAMRASGAAVSPEFMTVLQVGMTILMIGLYIVLPVLFILLYRGRHVTATCEWKDPRTRWTDRCPLPVLAVAVVWAYAALMSWTMLPYSFVPVFGVLLTGLPAVGVLLLLGAVCLGGALAVYRLRPAGWWGSVALILVGTASGVVTFSRLAWTDMYRAMGYGDEQIELMSAFEFGTGMMVVWSALAALVMIGYLVAVRRYFGEQPPAEPAVSGG